MLIILTVFGYNIYSRYCLIRYVKNHSLNLQSIPMLVNGRRIKAFTIEKTTLLHTSKTISIDFISAFILFVLTIIGSRSDKLAKTYMNYARMLCYNELIADSEGAHYIVNLRESVKKLSFRKIQVFVCANAIHRYNDTLPIYNIQYDRSFALNYKSIMQASIIFAFVTLVTIVSINYFSHALANKLMQTTDLHHEEILWSYINEDLKSNRVDLLALQNELQNSVLDEIKSDKYEFKIYISDYGPDIVLYPAGNIVISEDIAKNLKSKNQATFFLAHMIKHYENKDHLKAIACKIINLRIISKIFGMSSFYGKMLVWKSDFKHLHYSDFQEIVADEYALKIINEKFHSATGSDIFNDINHNLWHQAKTFNSHPISKIRGDNLDENIIKYGIPFLKSADLAHKIDEAFIPTTFSNSMQNFIAIFNQYRATIDEQYKLYHDFLHPFNQILHFNDQLTLLELKSKETYLTQSIQNMNQYKIDMQSKINEFDARIRDSIMLLNDNDQKQELMMIWFQEKQSLSNKIDFYFERDHQVLENQLIIIRFLINRFKSFTIQDSKIIFQTAKEKSDYGIMQKKIEEILKRNPPTNSLVINQ